ncbi:MAG: hypothetical protein INR63_06680 [Actinomycetospora chiangmaiensis]|nr:hypothetical protein [Actinomycetospora chiangmaiensis]
MTEFVPFNFDTCEDADACRAGIRELLAPGMDWSEVHCGRCGRQGIVRHADLVPAAPPAPGARSRARPACGKRALARFNN